MDDINKEVKYIGFYDLPGGKYKRVSSIAATNKMDYISDVLIRAGFHVHIVSPSWYDEASCNAKFQFQNTLLLNDKKRVTFCPGIGTKDKKFRNFTIFCTLIWLFFWLVKNVRHNEKILVYHVQWLSLPIRWAKRIKRFKLILEVEEIYGQVWENKDILQKWEQQLIKIADYYIAVSDVLAEKLGDKVRAIVYGAYSVPKLDYETFINGKVNVIYAGSLDSYIKGAFNSVKCAQYLPKEFLLHICGFGKEEDVNEIKMLIKQINIKVGREACIYHGGLIGDDYVKLLSSCKIGLNPQIEGKYMNTAFPSKIISYLSFNLRVVSTRIESIEKSPFKSIIIFQQTDTSESLAKAIRSINFTQNYNSTKLIADLDYSFLISIKDLLND